MDVLIKTIGSVFAAFGLGVASLFGGHIDIQKVNNQNLGAAIPTVVSLFNTSLASSIGANDTTMSLVSGLTKDGTTLASSTYGLTIDEGTASEEFVIANCTNTSCTQMQRGISSVDGYTSISALKKVHRRGASVKITDAPTLVTIARILNGVDTFPNKLSYNATKTISSLADIVDANYVQEQLASTTTAFNGLYFRLATDNTVTSNNTFNGSTTFNGTTTFTKPNYFSGVANFITATISGVPTSGTDIVNKDYADGLIIAGGTDGSTTVKGVFEEATQAEIVAGTGAGATGARLAINPSTLVSGGKIISTLLPTEQRGVIGGDGSDGAVTVNSGTTTLTRDMYYSTLVVNGTGTIDTAGFRVYASSSITVDTSGGGGGIVSVGGAGGNASGATAGSGGTAPTGGTLPPGNNGGAGSAGATNTFFQASSGTAGSASALGLGVAGSAGGNGALPTGTVGGAGGAGGAITGTITQTPRSYTWANNLFQFSSNTATAIERYKSSAGSGGGGGGSINGVSCTSGGGGGGGSSGGTVFVESPTITLTGAGAIRSYGGAGGNGANASGGNACGGGGGGGGGPGGLVIAIYKTLSGTGTITAPGGAGGTAGTSVGAGTAAVAGTVGSSGKVITLITQ